MFRTNFLILFLCLGMALSVVAGPVDAKYEKLKAKAEQTGEGFLSVQRHANKLYLEIPDSIFGRDLLLASRVEQISSTKKAVAGQMVRNPLMIRFSRDEKNVYLHNALKATSTLEEDAISISFDRNNKETVMQVFPIALDSKLNKRTVIDVTKYLNAQIPQISPFGGSSLGRAIAQTTKTVDARAYNDRVELVTEMGFAGTRSSFSCSLHRSIVLLPEVPMQPRLASNRMIYYQENKKELSSEYYGAKSFGYIKRWRLEPKAEDVERFKNGELVEPKKPIVFWVDNSIPEVWKPYIMAGIEDWQRAFEAIGFKNAIQAKEFPENDPNFYPNDFNNSCFRYVTIEKANAMGNHWIDPRSGEILQGDVLFYHDVFEKLYLWRFAQTAANDPAIHGEVSKVDTKIIGDLVRYAAAHEIGHSLGMMHNYRASYAYPVDSLRSPSFTKKYGTAASIMDYARNNYVAQPEDKGVSLTPPVLGVFDYFAIKWAYKPIYSASTPEEEVAVINQWMDEKSADDMYLFGTKNGMGDGCMDPSVLTESLGDDVIKAGKYGVKNAKLIMENLVEWSAADVEGNKHLKTVYEAVVKQYNQYIKHATTCLGGMYEFEATNDTHPALFVHLTEAHQREALDFILNELLTQYDWLNNKAYTERVGPMDKELIVKQGKVVESLVNRAMFTRMFTCASSSNDPFTVEEYLAAMTKTFFSVSKEVQSTYWMQNIQIEYVKNLKKMYDEGNDKTAHVFSSIVNANLFNELQTIEKLGAKQAKRGNAHFNYLQSLCR